MLQLTTTERLFEGFTIAYIEPVTGKKIIRTCEANSLEATKEAIQRQAIIDLCKYFSKHQKDHLTWLENNDAFIISDKKKSNILELEKNIYKLIEFTDLRAAADFSHFYILPVVVLLSPKTNSPKFERYNRNLKRFTDLLDNLQEDDILNVKHAKNDKKTPVS